MLLLLRLSRADFASVLVVVVEWDLNMG